jgi:hypothetical protein
LYFGVIKNGKEKNQEQTIAAAITINKGFRHLKRKITRLEESKSSSLLILLNITENQFFVKSRQLFGMSKRKLYGVLK